MARHNDLGIQGEEAACEYLMRAGCRILARNWRFRHLEVDIVCSYEDLLIVVEVKTRMARDEDPAELLGWKKRRNLIQAADAFIKLHHLSSEVRIDLIIVDGDTFEVEHFPDAVTIFD